MVQEAKAGNLFGELLEKVEAVPPEEVEAVCRQLRELVSELRPDGSVLAAAGQFTQSLSSTAVYLSPAQPLHRVWSTDRFPCPLKQECWPALSTKIKEYRLCALKARSMVACGRY